MGEILTFTISKSYNFREISNKKIIFIPFFHCITQLLFLFMQFIFQIHENSMRNLLYSELKETMELTSRKYMKENDLFHMK